MRSRKFSLQPELILYLSVLCYLSPGLIIPFLAACVLHEFGHIAMLHCIKHCIYSVKFRIHGTIIESGALGYSQTILASFAGPVLNFTGVLYWPLSPAFGFYNLTLGLYNLLPLQFLDGGTILLALLSTCLPPDMADLISQIVSIVTGVLLFIIGIIAAFHIGIFPFLISSMILFRCIMGHCLVS